MHEATATMVEQKGSMLKRRVNCMQFKVDPSISSTIRDSKKGNTHKKRKLNEEYEGSNADKLLSMSKHSEDTYTAAKKTKHVNSKKYKQVMQALYKPVSSYTLLYEPHLVPKSKKTPGKKVSFKITEPKTKSKENPTARKSDVGSAKWDLFPNNVRTLIATGMLDGVGVKYLSASREVMFS